MLGARFVLVAALAVAVAACADPCKSGEHECRGDVARFCNIDGDGVSWSDTTCISAALCVSSDAEQYAWCTLETAPNPACPSTFDGVACDGTDRVYCILGYVTERAACLACAPSGPDDCRGGYGAACAMPSDCVAGLQCIGNACSLPCSCPDKALGCDECDNGLITLPWPDTQHRIYSCWSGACRVVGGGWVAPN